jgi:Xaa-Pro aminopeptidase
VSPPGAQARRGSELPFPSAVLAERMRRVQARLRADGLAGALLFDPENIYYLTCFQTVAVTARGVEVITRFPRDLITV